MWMVWNGMVWCNQCILLTKGDVKRADSRKGNYFLNRSE